MHGIQMKYYTKRNEIYSYGVEMTDFTLKISNGKHQILKCFKCHVSWGSISGQK